MLNKPSCHNPPPLTHHPTGVILLIVGMMFSLAAPAQSFVEWFNRTPDSSYVVERPDYLSLNTFMSTKFTSIGIHDQDYEEDLEYLPNQKFITGFGASYKIVSFNIGLFSPNNQESIQRFGRTRIFDLQSHWYLRHFNIDFFFSRYKGYYLSNAINIIEGWDDETQYPKRPDIHTDIQGLNINYTLNSKRFSYKAAYNQSEWQKKSAGSPFIGIGIFKAVTRADSSLIPAHLLFDNYYHGYHFNRMEINSVVANMGYSYTLVVRKNWFTSLTIGLSVGRGVTRLHFNKPINENRSLTALRSNGTLRFAMGYNSERFSVSFNYFNYIMTSAGLVNNTTIQMSTGTLSINTIYRFNVPDMVQRAGDWVNKQQHRLFHQK